LEPNDEIELASWPVRPLVNNVRNDGPDLVAPLDPAELAATATPGLFDALAG
jgi:hypothetical protein